jgi:catecholate siderophore receptor
MSRNRHSSHLCNQTMRPAPATWQAVLKASMARPLTHATISVASVMLSTTALAQSSETNLPTIEVQGETGGGYQATSSTIPRLPVPLRDTPQTVNVITQQVIQEQRVTTMEDALRYVPGITFSAGEGAQQGDGPIIRGFVARGDLFREGIRDPGWYTRDLFSADRVEVYKGPSAFAFGRGATGGAINTVSKLPTGATFAEGTLTGTTGPGVRDELDVSGKTGNVAGRIAALFQDIDTPTRDNVWTKRWGVAPSLAVDVTDRTKVTLSYIYQGEQGAPDYGVTYLPQPAFSPVTGALTNPGYFGGGAPVLPLPVPRSNWYGVPTGPLRDITETTTHIATAKIEHEFDNGIKVSNATRYIDNERFSLPTSLRNIGNAANQLFANGATAGLPSFGFPAELMTVGRERRVRETDNTYLVNQTDFVAKVDAGIMTHTLVGGLELTRETRNQDRLDICDPVNIACRTNVVFPDPTPSPIGGAPVLMKPIDTEATNTAVFVSDQAKLNKYIELLVSLRYDRFATVYDDPNQALAANRHLQRTDDMLSYRFGVVGHPTSNSSVYVAYGNSFNPSAELGTLANASVANLAPEQTTSLESGVKVDVLDNRLSLTGAVFRIEKANLRITDPTDNTVSRLDGIARVDGIELGAVGKVTDRWNVFAGYSHLQSRIEKDPNLNELGRELPNTPEHNVTFWTTYDLTPQLTIGVGAVHQSFGFANITNVAYVPAFWKFDAMVSYRVTGNATLQLNVYNITDEFYYAQYFGANAVPASGRWASLSLRMRF